MPCFTKGKILCMKKLSKRDEPRKCYDCKYAELMQWFNNPVIAQCMVLGRREVAQAKRRCEKFEQNNGTREIAHFSRYE